MSLSAGYFCSGSEGGAPHSAPAPIRVRRCPGAPAPLFGDSRDQRPHAASAGDFATTLAADERFLAAALTQGAPESRHRFAPACIENDCAYWKVGGCELLGRIAQLLAEAEAPVKPRPAHDCSIRKDCQWRRQRGDAACGICGFVVS